MCWSIFILELEIRIRIIHSTADLCFLQFTSLTPGGWGLRPPADGATRQFESNILDSN